MESENEENVSFPLLLVTCYFALLMKRCACVFYEVTSHSVSSAILLLHPPASLYLADSLSIEFHFLMK